MKRLICFSIALLILLGCLTGCHFTKNVSGQFAGEAEATPKVEEMMMALAEGRTSDAKSLMHPQIAEAADSAIAQMSDYLADREASSLEVQSISVNTSTGTSGKTTQEQVAYRVTLNDGTVIYLSVLYLSDKAGTGFASFQMVLGVI